jgi:DNA repair exonuclease SbcCD nuclease subunit
MRPVRFVHAADLHLGAPFSGVDASDARVQAALVASIPQSLDRIVALCLEEKVDFLLLAGDVYNGGDKSTPARFRFRAAMQRLADAAIPVYIARGNHDPADAWSSGPALPATVRYFSTAEVEAVTVERDGEVLCTLYGRGYEHAAEKRDLAAGFRRSERDGIAVGVLHANVGGREGYLDYAPASMDTLRGARMDYWALGHIHKPEILSASPMIVYAGSPQGLNPKETGDHGCYLVEVGSSGAKVEFRPLCSIVWSRSVVDASKCTDAEDVRDLLRGACEEMRADAGGRPAIARIEMTGRSEAHEALVRGTAMADLLADLREEQLAADPWVWIDRVSDHTAASLDIDRLRGSQDFAGDLVRLVDGLAAEPGGVGPLLTEILGPVESAVGEVERDLSQEELLLRARDLCLEILEDGAR